MGEQFANEPTISHWQSRKLPGRYRMTHICIRRTLRFPHTFNFSPKIIGKDQRKGICYWKFNLHFDHITLPHINHSICLVLGRFINKTDWNWSQKWEKSHKEQQNNEWRQTKNGLREGKKHCLVQGYKLSSSKSGKKVQTDRKLFSLLPNATALG